MQIGRITGIVCAAAALLSACGAPRQSPSLAPTSASQSQCELRVQGNHIITATGKPVLLYGATLPTLSVMAASTYPADARLRDLAAAGASVVSLAIVDAELMPTFVPAQVLPFIQQAHQLGMLVILRWDATINDPVNTNADNAEDWIRLATTYVNSTPGVWFELYNDTEGISPARARNIALRMLDVARGYRASNIVVVNDPAWLRETDTAINAPLPGAGIVYGVQSPEGLMQAGPSAGYDFAQQPFIVTRWQPDANAGDDLARFKSLEVGALATGIMDAPGQIPAAVSEFWKANQVDWQGCR